MSDKEMRETTPDEMSDIVELTSDDGKVMKFYHLGTIEYKENWYACFQPAEEIEGITDEEVVIFKLDGDEGHESLFPIEDEALLEEVYEEFCRIMEEDDEACEAEELECDCGCDCGDECSCDDTCDCGCHHDHKN